LTAIKSSEAADLGRMRLRRSRRLASGLLALSGGVFVMTLAIPQPSEVWLLVRAVSEAAMVGGLADWFAVVALFRHPLGLPIPHTAILPANKERIGEGLARFLDRNFLTPELLLPEIRSLNLAERLAGFLASRRNATALSAEIAKALPFVLRAADDRQIVDFLTRALGSQFNEAQFARILGLGLRVVTSTGYHEAVLDAALDHARVFLADHRDSLLATVGERRRRWIPRAVNREIARAMLRAAGELLEDLRQPHGAARQALLAKLDEIAQTLAAGPENIGFIASSQSILNRPEVRKWIAESWAGWRDLLLRDLAAPASNTRRIMTLMIASVGDTLKADPAIRQRLDSAIEALTIEALPWRAELVRFVSEVVRRWEPRAFSDRIEVAVGADLQYIRMNGTVVGGLVGGLLYALSLLAR
jgi:uncharacterized membrane-anchored protein YjiN (DUF445 family)